MPKFRFNAHCLEPVPMTRIRRRCRTFPPTRDLSFDFKHEMKHLESPLNKLSTCQDSWLSHRVSAKPLAAFHPSSELSNTNIRSAVAIGHWKDGEDDGDARTVKEHVFHWLRARLHGQATGTCADKIRCSIHRHIHVVIFSASTHLVRQLLQCFVCPLSDDGRAKPIVLCEIRLGEHISGTWIHDGDAEFVGVRTPAESIFGKRSLVVYVPLVSKF